MSTTTLGLNALSTPTSDDVLQIVDVHDSTQSGAGSTKKITFVNLMSATPVILQNNAGSTGANQPIINSVQGWNNAAVAFTAWQLNIANVASATTSLLLDLQVGSTSVFKVGKAGDVTTVGKVTAAAQITNAALNTGFGMGGNAGSLQRITWDSVAKQFGFIDSTDVQANIIVANITALGTIASSAVISNAALSTGFGMGGPAGAQRITWDSANQQFGFVDASDAQTNTIALNAQLLGNLVISGSSLTTPTAGNLAVGKSTTNSATAGTNGAVPAQVLGYLIWHLGTTTIKVPYFSN